MSIDYTEKGFETNIEDSLIDSGYIKRKLEDEDLENFRKYAIDVEVFFKFLEESQQKELDRLKKIYKEAYKLKILDRLNKELNSRGMIDCIRHGIKDYGVTLRLAYNKPVSSMNQILIDLYGKNIFTESRQVYYSSQNTNSIDMMISINGLPIAISELKNPLTGQTVDNAKKQYIEDRDPRELLFQFKKRAIVYFAVDPDEVYMTTQLNKEKTFFLPFNKGCNGGKGNPVQYDDYKTSYLWKEILQKDSLIDILFRFVFVKQEDIKDSTGEIIDKKETVIFPRYHQLDVVRKIEEDVTLNGVGKNYLVQHSAGSGKTNSISWLSHRLAKIHNSEDIAVFDTVIVITDRRVLDKQLQDAVYQLEHKAGMVEKIDKDSTQLANAITNGTRIVITTLQKFPFIMEKVGEFERGKYAVIIDEAHSSQGGKSATAMTNILSDKTLEEALEADRIYEENMEDIEEKIVETIIKSGKQDNISFFAFTATPKAKTLEKFGNIGTDGKPHAFHTYTMRQAIEEGFILDVLKNYTTYKTFFKIAKKIEEDPEVGSKKAYKEMAKYVSLHPHNIAQKTEIMIEHYRQVARHKIGGRAKAMVVTGSRLHAVKYKQAFDKYIDEKGYKELKALVAFSGTVQDKDGSSFTEPEMNGFSEKELPEKFHSDEYKVLLVAEKYQTGFDEPLLHTMYVDKPLDGIKAVQTLSRLNRTCKGKNDTFVLDFVNEAEDIQKAFQPYYEVTALEDTTDPNLLYDLQRELDAFMIYTQEEINDVCKLEFSTKKKTVKTQEKLNAILDIAVQRYNKETNKEKKDEFKGASSKFIRTYSFILQIGPFADVSLHKLYVYLNYLLKKLPKNVSEGVYLADDVALEYYRNDKIFEGSISLSIGEESELKPTSFGKGVGAEEEKKKLSEIIEKLNDKFATDFTDTDKLSYEQIKEDIINNVDLAQKAQNNTKDNFKFSYQKAFLDVVIARMAQNEKFFMKILEDSDFKDTIMEFMFDEVYQSFSKII
ncbi:type I restriction endonuclease subunit R [Clostridium tetani]|uniref:type I restriction endonuclease subunit R n=1 Tax=Clostridium tetani TaxID=1513 RepID=UPI00100C0CC0|nr:DEAD/DEAH box helicase family protein [Clostridium tetani]RXI51511.1 type I restriction endonuclease subunit R [Clostridium tetani]RXM71661.1 type I restriction endonuclease subunit R [Clostridium tetani]BDR85077.1 type I restriction endonuclease subunit R [Clostridium tetani]